MFQVRLPLQTDVYLPLKPELELRQPILLIEDGYKI